MRVSLFVSLDGNVSKKDLINALNNVSAETGDVFSVCFFSKQSQKKTKLSTEIAVTYLQKQTEDEGVNEFVKTISENDNAIIIRENAIIKDYDFIKKITKKLGDDSQIITIKTTIEKDSFKEKLRSFVSKLLSIFFGFSLFAGKSGVIAFDNNVVSSLKTMSNKTNRLTKIDALIGYTKSYITSEISFRSYKTTKRQKTSATITAVIFVIIISLWVLLSLCVPKVNTVVFHLSCVMLTIVLVCIMFMNFLKIYTYKEVGDLIA